MWRNQMINIIILDFVIKKLNKKKDINNEVVIMPENLSPRYSLGEIISGILISTVGIIFVSAFFDVFTYEKTYNNYCCCNLETIYYPFNTSYHLTNDQYSNAFCILYNLTKKNPTTKVDELSRVTNIINGFKSKIDMTEKDFMLYLYQKKIPLYIIPNFQCHYTLNQFNIDHKEIKYKCIDLSIEKE